MSAKRRALVTGIALVDVPNLASAVAANLASSSDWLVDQKWVAIGSNCTESGSLDIVEHLASGEPKFAILNRLLGNMDLSAYDFIIVTDDDIELPGSFLDRYLALADCYDFALAQPARSHDSYIDHVFVEQLDGITARQTHFVEIGPLFSMRADALPFLLPFDISTPMGWGYDFTWPSVMKKVGLKMGIVDALPVRHNLRKPVVHYNHADADAQMKAYLSGQPHLTKAECFFIVESYS